MKEKAYTSLIRPKLEYSSCVWDPHTKSNISKLEMVQRRAARHTCNRFHNTSSVTNMLTVLKWPQLQLRRTRTRLIFFYKIIYHLVAIYPTNLLVPSDSRTRQYTHSHSYRHIHTSLDSYKYSIRKPLYSGTCSQLLLYNVPHLTASKKRYHYLFSNNTSNYQSTVHSFNHTAPLYIIITFI